MYGRREEGVLGIGTGDVLARRLAFASRPSCRDPELVLGFEERTISLVPVRGRELGLEARCSSEEGARARSLVVKNLESSSARVAALAVWAEVPFVSAGRALTATKPDVGEAEVREPFAACGECVPLRGRASDSRRAMIAFLRFLRR